MDAHFLIIFRIAIASYTWLLRLIQQADLVPQMSSTSTSLTTTSKHEYREFRGETVAARRPPTRTKNFM
ncbi:hypothetical protein LTR95_006395 [Oleoguttula sp. CCFEE 5521]